MNVQFDSSSDVNQTSLKRLEELKNQGWTVTDAKRAEDDPEILLIVMAPPPIEP
ncbi:MAG: hypothetical protein HY735_25895 [Verrucomicrobia bacterium]|nr:hypothetical protein [Verrucomicrobiota bacterium]